MEEINNFQQDPDENIYQAWEIPTRQIIDSRGAIPSKTVVDAKIAIQEMAEHSQKWYNGTSRRNQGDDLMPTIKEGEVIEEFRTRDDELNIGIDDYPSYCDYDKKIHIDLMTDFVVLENIDDYRDEGMGDVIFGEPFLREVGIKTKRFEGIITLYNGDDEVTYQMVRSHLRFKRHTNEQCNKIPPLLKVSEKDEVNGILHAY
ncbi:hypothetical protein Tco_1100470 [Tanacetum coccineum]